LNYLLIFGPGIFPAMGINGAALGTVIARALSLFIGMYILYSGKNKVHIVDGTYWPDWKMFKDIFSIGLPSGVQGVLRRGANLFLIGFITATELGTYGAAALAIGWQIEQLIVQPIVGVNVVGTSQIGQIMGRWQIKEAITKGNILIGLGFFIGLVLIIPSIYFAEPLIRLFDPSAHPLVMEGAVSFFHIVLASLLFGAIPVVITGILRGTGHTTPPMYSTLVFRNIVPISLAYILGFVLDWGAIGVWWAIAIGRFFDSLTLIIVWVRKRWINVALSYTDIFRQHLHKLNPEMQNSFLKEYRSNLMAQSGMTELIGDDRVTYQGRNGSTVILFQGDSFQVK